MALTGQSIRATASSVTSAVARMLAYVYAAVAITPSGNILRCPLAHFYSAVDKRPRDRRPML